MLKEKRAVAIMPSRQEKSPYVAYEAMENQLPFLVSFTGGTAELIHPDDWPQAELPAEPAAMAEKIAGVLRHGLRPARLAFDPLEVELQSLAMWRTLAAEKAIAPSRPVSHPIRLSFTDWPATAGRDPQEIVALVPPGIDVNDRHLDAMARLLAACPEANIVEPYCRVVDEETGAEMSSLQLKKKATPREAALIAGPLPLVVRAGVIADLSPALATAPPAELYAAFMAAAEEAGTAVLSIPLETHRSRFVSGIEQRAICNRLWLPLGRKRPARESVSNAGTIPPQAQESPKRPAQESWQLCGMLSDDPFVAISMFTPECPYGALSLFPEAFQEKPSLHLIHMDHSLLWAASTLLPRRLAEARERWPQARFRLLAADEAELRGLLAAGLPAMLCNLNMFADERVFHPFRPEAASQTTDAICIAPLDLRENHHLARTIGSTGIVHHRYEGMDDVGAEVRRLLPQATFLNDTEQEEQGFFYPSDEQLAGWICQAATGLALSETGGSCIATAQYLLCGTPVVTVPNVGGRDHFLKQPFFVRADTTAESVAAAIRAIKARNLSRQEVHEATKTMFVEARKSFLVDLNAAMRDVFGSGHRIDDVSGLVGQVVRYRRTVDVLRPPDAPRQAAAPRHRRWPAWLTLNRRRGENRE
jgi:glycosyltransferase involved in cell wall biosynthesis